MSKTQNPFEGATPEALAKAMFRPVVGDGIMSRVVSIKGKKKTVKKEKVISAPLTKTKTSTKYK